MPTDNPATQPDVCLCNGANPGAGWLPDKLMKMGFTVADRKNKQTACARRNRLFNITDAILSSYEIYQDRYL